MASQSSISLCIFLVVCVGVGDVLAFSTTTASSSAISRAPIATRQEWQTGVEIELPNLELLFDRISQASPLAKLVMEGKGNSYGGFDAIDDDVKHPELKWKRVEENKKKTVHCVDKADRFQGVKTPILRFRSSIKGPCIGERFSHFILDIDERKKWDENIAMNFEMYPIDPSGEYCQIDNAILCNSEKYGNCERIGVGYTQTKQGIISPREQLILGGMQKYDNGATILWGTEMEEQHNHLLPDGPRHTRSKSHLFAATLVPTSSNSFDVEYLLQMDVGGGLPHFMTTPAITDIVKKLFDHTKNYFEGGEGSELDQYLKSRVKEESSDIEKIGIDEDDYHSYHLNDLESLLFTPS